MRAAYYRKRKNRKKIKGIVILICSLFLILISVYIFLFSPIFSIKTVEIYGNRDINSQEIIDSSNYTNFFLATKNKIKYDLLARFPRISELEVEKSLSERKIKISIKEREEFGIVCRIEKIENSASASTEVGTPTDKIENCFYIDKGGVIFKDAPQTSGSLVILIKDYSGREYQLGEKIYNENVIDFISFAKEFLTSQINLKFLDFNILSFPPDDLKAITDEGWYILFNLQKRAEDQLQALKAVLNEKIKEGRKNLEYVDLRIKNRVYYK